MIRRRSSSRRSAWPRPGARGRDEVYDRTIPQEREKDLEKKGAAVVITVDRINDLGGKIIQE